MPSRQLLCERCTEDMRRIVKRPDIVDAGESARFVPGTSRFCFACDSCSAYLGPGIKCTATTIFARGETLGPWEGEYVVPDEGAPC